jgi:hypothetical protein
MMYTTTPPQNRRTKTMKKYYHVITERNDEYVSTVAIADSIETVKAHFAGQSIREIIELNAAQVNTISAAATTTIIDITAEQPQTSTPETVKCVDLYTATFEDGTLMTGTLNQLYAAQNSRRMSIKPVVWLWCSDSGLYMVDYILEGAGWTLGVFDTLANAEKAVAAFNAQPAADVAAMLTADALKRFSCEVQCKALGDDGKQYDAVWCPDCGQIYYTIPAKVNVLGYISQYKEV